MPFWLDCKTGVRQLRRAPGMALASIVTLAVGIGTTAAVFSFIAAVLSAASPVDDMDRRVALWSRNRAEAETKNAVSAGDFLEWRRRATLLDSAIATRNRSATLGGLDNAVRVGVQEVTPNFFEFFRWSASMGRTFLPADAAGGAPRVIVVSHAFWRNDMASRADAVGTIVRLDGEPATIIGVLPRMPAVSGIYTPLAIEAAAADHATRNLFVFAHLRDGVTIDQARGEMDTIGQTLERELPSTNRGWTVNTRPLQEEYIGPQARLAFAILAGAVASVLLIGCVNVANLLLARGFARRGELAVRVALGASSGRVARQLLVECGVIAAAGAIASVLVSRWTVQFFQGTAQLSIDSPWMDANGLNVRALSITALAAVVATLTSGLAPVLAARRTDVVSGLQASGRSGVRTNRRVTSTLVAAEIALAVLLLIVSGLLMRTLIAIESLAPGFDVRDTLTATVTLPQATPPAEAAQWFERAVARTRTLPGVLSAAATSRVPFAGSRFNPNRGLEIEGRTAAAGEGTWAVDYIVTPQLLETLRVPLVEGRTFIDGDGGGAPLVAIVSEAMVRRFWPDRSPLGARVRQGDEPDGEWRSVVGVVADIRNDDADSPPIPYLYVPLAQRPARTMTLVLRTAGDAASFTAPLRRAIAELDPDRALYDVRTMEDVLEADLAGSRVLIEVFSAFAAIALGLAGLGVWAVAAQSVGQRTREIGVRVALGASAGTVMRLIAMQTLVPMLAGLGLGLLAGLGVARVMRSILFQVSPNDPVTIAMTIGTLAAVGVAATLGPAVRAARMDPLIALRDQ